MKIQYQTIAIRTKALALIAKANAIIEDYERQGYKMTLRQLYYQLVSRNVIPNNQHQYDQLGQTISNGRRAGLVDWDAIVDRTRFLRTTNHWASPSNIIDSCAAQYKEDLWAGQESYVEVWFEKDALLGVFERSAEAHRLPIFSNRGYVSDSSVWEAAQRLARAQENGHRPVVLHFGDHDPSGLDMTRDITDRLDLFGAGDVLVKRIALNMDQIRKYNPPPNPAKESDSRFTEYKALYGDQSWELDALDPDVLVQLVATEIRRRLDLSAWAKALKKEHKGKRGLERLAKVDWKVLMRSLPRT